MVDSMTTANWPTSGLRCGVVLAAAQSSAIVRTTIWVQLGAGLVNENRSTWPAFPYDAPQQAGPGVGQWLDPCCKFLSSDAGLRMMQPEGGLIWAKAGVGLMLSITGAAQIKAPVRADRLRRSRRDTVPGPSMGFDSVRKLSAQEYAIGGVSCTQSQEPDYWG